MLVHATVPAAPSKTGIKSQTLRHVAGSASALTCRARGGSCMLVFLGRVWSSFALFVWQVDGAVALAEGVDHVVRHMHGLVAANLTRRTTPGH